MSIQRRSLFGIPQKPVAGSVNTSREVPLSTGMDLSSPWPLIAPGSAQSMSNFWPMEGWLQPRSRLSSLNTLRPVASAIGMTPFFYQNSTGATVWVSDATGHAKVTSNGSISRASFVSSFGLGVGGLASSVFWQYASAFAANLSENMVVAAGSGSNNTLMAIYENGSGQPTVSYLTSAPKAAAVGAFDSYLIAFNTADAGAVQASRVRWCVRGNPSNWTGEGSGFEDLLEMRGIGRKVLGLTDGRFLLFTDEEIWYGVGAAYPAQFTFSPLDRRIGTYAAATVQDTEYGVVFLGSDLAIRIIPRDGGPSRIISGPIQSILRRLGASGGTYNLSWAVYDQIAKLYHFFLSSAAGVAQFAAVVNLQTGAWSLADYPVTPTCGTYVRNSAYIGSEGLFFGNSTGTVYSTSSLLGSDTLPVSGVTAYCRFPLAADLAGNYKQITQVDADYRATSKSTLTLKISQDGGNTYESPGRAVSLPVAAVSGRATSQMYLGGAFPFIEIKSESTGFELHRLDVSMNIGGRR